MSSNSCSAAQQPITPVTPGIPQTTNAQVRAAITAGIRHIDTAAIYKNSDQIATALWDEARVPRRDVFM